MDKKRITDCLINHRVPGAAFDFGWVGTTGPAIRLRVPEKLPTLIALLPLGNEHDIDFAMWLVEIYHKKISPFAPAMYEPLFEEDL